MFIKIIKHGAKLRHIRYILIVLKNEKGAASRCGNINFGCDVDLRGWGGSNTSSKPLAQAGGLFYWERAKWKSI